MAQAIAQARDWGETGWPSEGRQREAAVASRVNQARFMREFSQAAADHHLNYNFIEGFDQPWKRGQEGAMGGNWGVFDSDGQAKFPATGPVAEDPYWYLGWLGAVVGLAAALGLSRRWQLTERLSQVQMLALGAATGGLVVAQLRYGMVWNRNALEWGATVLLGAASLLLMFRVAQLLVPGRSDRPVGQGATRDRGERSPPPGYAPCPCRRGRTSAQDRHPRGASGTGGRPHAAPSCPIVP